MMLGQHIGERQKGVSVRLHSDFPFPWRKQGGPRDQFESEAFEHLRKAPDQAYYKFETIDQVYSLRYAKADIMRESCISCHNNHLQTPKNDWLIGDLREVLAVVLPIKEANFEGVKYVRENILFFIFFGTLSIFLGFHFMNWLKDPGDEEHGPLGTGEKEG